MKQKLEQLMLWLFNNSDDDNYDDQLMNSRF